MTQLVFTPIGKLSVESDHLLLPQGYKTVRTVPLGLDALDSLVLKDSLASKLKLGVYKQYLVIVPPPPRKKEKHMRLLIKRSIKWLRMLGIIGAKYTGEEFIFTCNNGVQDAFFTANLLERMRQRCRRVINDTTYPLSWWDFLQITRLHYGSSKGDEVCDILIAWGNSKVGKAVDLEEKVWARRVEARKARREKKRKKFEPINFKSRVIRRLQREKKGGVKKRRVKNTEKSEVD